MWRNNQKPKPEVEKPKYEVGDRVRVWPVYKNPVGRVYDVFEKGGKTLFRVEYEYHTGKWISEEFEGSDLTLYEKNHRQNCNCGSNSSRHKDWCNKTMYPNGW